MIASPLPVEAAAAIAGHAAIVARQATLGGVANLGDFRGNSLGEAFRFAFRDGRTGEKTHEE